MIIIIILNVMSSSSRRDTLPDPQNRYNQVQPVADLENLPPLSSISWWQNMLDRDRPSLILL